MKVNDLLEQIQRQKVAEAGLKHKLGAIGAASLMSLHPGNYSEPVNDQVSQTTQIPQQQHVHKNSPYYMIGRPYQIKGKTFHPKFEPQYQKTGVASWYGPGFHGKKTANGDIFNTNAMMAAHPTLPLPSKAWVTNLENGKKVLVTITDRGPYAKGRLIDLSKKAAEELGYLGKGTAKVKVEYDPQATEEYLKQKGLYDQYKKINKLGDK